MPSDFLPAAFAKTLFQLSKKGGLASALQAVFWALRDVIPLEFIHVYKVNKKSLGHFSFLICAFYDASGQEMPETHCDMQDMGMFGRLEEKYYKEPQICNNIQDTPSTSAISRVLFPEFYSAMNQYLFQLENDFFFLGVLSRQPDIFTPEHARFFATVHETCVTLCQQIVSQQREIMEARESSVFFGQRIVAKSPSDMLHLCHAMPEVVEFAEDAALSHAPVLILGESGVGKEVLADAIQALSARKNGPYIKINCGALTETLLDSELFGHERGAFTGALRENPGYFEQAHGGTLLLDEVGELSLQAQVRLLRVLDRKEVQRVGGGIRKGLDVRVIAVTNQNINRMLAEGTFRNDLYFRLNTLKITVPPLRKRREDIPALAHVLWEEKAREYGMEKVPEIPENELYKLHVYPWPGNVREMSAVLDRAMLMYKRTQVVRFYVEEAPTVFRSAFGQAAPYPAYPAPVQSQVLWPAAGGLYGAAPVPSVPNLASEQGSPGRQNGLAAAASVESLEQINRRYIEDVLQRTGKVGGPGGAAQILGLHPNTLRARMKKLGIPTRPETE